MIADMKKNIVELERTYKSSLSNYENEQIHRKSGLKACTTRMPSELMFYVCVAGDSQKIDSLIDNSNRLSSSIRDSLKGM